MGRFVGYALAITAFRYTQGGSLQATSKPAWTSHEGSPDEAREIGLRIALSDMPISDGWFNHSSAAMEITEDMLCFLDID